MMRRAWCYFLSSFGDYLSETETLWRPLRWAVRDTWDWWRRPVQPTPEWAKQINEIIDTTLRNRSPQLVANITKNNALLAHLLKDKP